MAISLLVTYMWPQPQFLILNTIFFFPQVIALHLYNGFATSNVRQTRVTQPFACVLSGFSATYHFLHLF